MIKRLKEYINSGVRIYQRKVRIYQHNVGQRINANNLILTRYTLADIMSLQEPYILQFSQAVITIPSFWGTIHVAD